MDVGLLDMELDSSWQVDRTGRELGVPLCVDLDGTLVKTDILIESFIALLKRNPLLLPVAPFWLMKGKAYLKQQIANHVELDVEALPYREELLQYLREQRLKGRHLVLATATNAKFAQRVAEHLGLFDQVLASDEQTNLAGLKKLERLCALFGEKGFDYVGNAKADLAIWENARRSILVSPERGVQCEARRLTNIGAVFEERRNHALEYLRAMRLHQWVKNLLVFVPLVAAHDVVDLPKIGNALLAFLAFSLCASSVYLLNDLFDLSADRRHVTKKQRPFAAGTLPITHGALLIPLLLVLAFAIAAQLPGAFVVALATYYGVTLVYSLKLKNMLVLDVLALAGLYTLRIIAGGEAVSITPSFWLLAFSMFLFFSLAIVKRASELIPLQNTEGAVRARSYRLMDLDALTSLGVPSGHMAVLVLALYINSDDINQMYTYPELIWLLCPLLLYWLARIWLLTRRGKMHDDPVVFALRDRASLLVAALAIVIMTAAV